MLNKIIIILLLCSILHISFLEIKGGDLLMLNTCYEYSIEARSNLDIEATDAIIRTEFIKGSNWHTTSTNLPKCGEGNYLLKICFDSNQLIKPYHSIANIMTNIYDQKIATFKLSKTGDIDSFTLGNERITYTVYTRHQH